MPPIESSNNGTTPSTRRRSIWIIFLVYRSPYRWYHIILRSLRILYQTTHTASTPTQKIGIGTCYKHRWFCIEVDHSRPAVSGSYLLCVGTSTLSWQTCLENVLGHWGCFGDWIGLPSVAVDSRTEGREQKRVPVLAKNSEQRISGESNPTLESGKKQSNLQTVDISS